MSKFLAGDSRRDDETMRARARAFDGDDAASKCRVSFCRRRHRRAPDDKARSEIARRRSADSGSGGGGGDGGGGGERAIDSSLPSRERGHEQERLHCIARLSHLIAASIARARALVRCKSVHRRGRRRSHCLQLLHPLNRKFQTLTSARAACNRHQNARRSACWLLTAVAPCWRASDRDCPRRVVAQIVHSVARAPTRTPLSFFCFAV